MNAEERAKQIDYNLQELKEVIAKNGDPELMMQLAMLNELLGIRRILGALTEYIAAAGSR